MLAALAKGIAITDRSQHAYLATHAIAVFNHMQQVVGAGVVPDSATFSAFIFVLEATGEHSAHIVAAHDMMLAVGVTPDCSTAAAILKAAMACGQTARAVQGAHALQLQGAAVDAPLLTSLLGSCLAAGAWDLAMRLCSSTQVAQGSAAAAVMFNFVLHSALTAGQYQNAMEVLDVMQAAKLEVEPTIAAKVRHQHPC